MKMKGRHYDCMASSDNIISCCYSYCNGNKLKKIKRIHAKAKTSLLKGSSNYVKLYNKQGR